MNHTMFRDISRCACGEEIQIETHDNVAEGRLEVALQVHGRYVVRHVDHSSLFSARSAQGAICAEAYTGANLLRQECPCRIDFSAVTDTSQVHQAGYEKIEVTGPDGRRFYHAVPSRRQQAPTTPAPIKPVLAPDFGKPLVRRIVK